MRQEYFLDTSCKTFSFNPPPWLHQFPGGKRRNVLMEDILKISIPLERVKIRNKIPILDLGLVSKYKFSTFIR